MRVVEAHGNDLDGAYKELMGGVIHHGETVDTGHWQATKNVPMTVTRELQNTVFVMPIPATPGALASFVKPNLPWAEDHFTKERVSGVPSNPGEEYKNWPWYRGNVEAHKEQGTFSHTYQERMWPKHANPKNLGTNLTIGHLGTRLGIRYRYGDLDDVAELLGREPYTRQAYVPIWFPEDTGAHHFERVPCTLGYHFMLRRDHLYCVYNIRSCDLVRYFRDDVYMAGRLTQWFLQRAKDLNPQAFGEVRPGTLTMMIPSLHVFEDEVPALVKKWKV